MARRCRRALLFAAGLGGSTGADRSALDVADAIVEAGYRVRLCVTNVGPDAAKWVFDRLGPRAVLKSPASLGRQRAKGTGGSPVEMVRSVARRARILREAVRADVVLVNGLYGHFVARSAGLDLRTATLIVRESPRHCQSHFWRRFGTRGEDVLGQYGQLILVSIDSLRAWECVGGIRSNRNVFVIPNTCDENSVDSLRKRAKQTVRRALGLPDGGFLTVCVGSVIHRKGHDLLIEAFRDVGNAVPGALLLLVGEARDEWGRALLGKCGKWSTVRWVGGQLPDRALEYIYAADCLALASRSEAMPRAVLEAMALETPVVAARAEGVSELVEPGRMGWVVPREDERALADALIEVARRPDVAARFAKAARDRFETAFARGMYRKRWAEALSQLEAGG